MATVEINVPELADELIAARPALDRRGQRLAIALYELLAGGRPVSRERLAQRAETGVGDVGRFLDDQPGVYLDAQGEVVGFWGMALEGMPHRMEVDGREIHAWCAWDTLFLPELIARAVTVRSTCPATAQPIELVVAPDGARNLSPQGAVLSFLRRETPFDADTIRSFCHFVHFFASQGAATEWTARHPGTFVLSIDDGLELARLVNRGTYGEILSGTAEGGP
jgi:alkylmercury lyase